MGREPTCSSPAPAPPPSSPTPSPAGPGSPPPLPLPTLPLPRLGQWPRRLDTPSPPAASRFLCQTKRDGSGAGPGRLGRTPAKGGLAGRGGTRAQWPWPWVSGRRCGAQPREGWGGNRPPQPSPALGGQMGQEWAGAGRSSRPQRPDGRHTWPVTHSQDTQSWITHVEMQMCMCVHAHIFGHTAQLEGSQFPQQGLNPGHASKSAKSNP